jgi:hypothetical protein
MLSLRNLRARRKCHGEPTEGKTRKAAAIGSAGSPPHRYSGSVALFGFGICFGLEASPADRIRQRVQQPAAIVPADAGVGDAQAVN